MPLLTSILHFFWTSVILHLFLVLAFLSTIAVTILAQQPRGPEGPIGAWLVLVIPCVFAAIPIFALALKGSLNFIPGGSLIQFIIAVGILITFSTVIFGLLGRYNSPIQGFFIAIPFLILAGNAAIIHHFNFPDTKLVYWAAAILLIGAALTGWGLAGRSIFHYIQKDLKRIDLRAQAEREQEELRAQLEIAEYEKLNDSASLNARLRFTWSRSSQIRQQAREKVSRFPGLDDKLIELLDQDSSEAISYIANVYENPPAKLAPAWGRMLEQQLKKWDSLQYDEYAGKWGNNLISFFKGAQKIQLAGGSLHNELQSWHKHLMKCKGLESLKAFVKSLLQTK